MSDTIKDPYAKSRRVIKKWKKDFAAGKTVCYNTLAADEWLSDKKHKEYDYLYIDELGNKTYIITEPVVWP